MEIQRRTHNRVPGEGRGRSARISGRHRMIALALLGLASSIALAVMKQHQPATGSESTGFRNAQPGIAYTGSQKCASCHAAIAQSYAQTDMGRSIVRGNDASLRKRLPLPATVFDQDTGQYFDVFARDGQIYQSVYGLDNSGKESFRQTWKLDYVMGAGISGYTAMVHRDRHLFEAPLTYYVQQRMWGLSPGYELENWGFSRAIIPKCLGCHSLLYNPAPGVADAYGVYGDPPFNELAIGCETCHGPGELHVKERLAGKAVKGVDTSIVNPAHLSGWLSDNICMRCHQADDARITQPGKRDSDFRPGTPLDDTISIFKLATDSGSPHASHYYGMSLSQCFRASGDRLHCTTCHDPHVQPTEASRAEYYRSRCLGCHTEQSCKLPIEKRGTNDCASCHMSKRIVPKISHISLTNHTILTRPPKVGLDLQPATSQKLLHISAPPDQWESLDTVSPLALFEAYRELVRQGHTEFEPKVDKLLNQLEKTLPSNQVVLTALAYRAALQKTETSRQQAIQYMRKVIVTGQPSTPDYLFLAQLYSLEKRPAEAIAILEKARAENQYSREIYEALAINSMTQENYGKALSATRDGLKLFPGDPKLQALNAKAQATMLH